MSVFLVLAALIAVGVLALMLRPLWSARASLAAPDPLADLRAQLQQIDALHAAGALDDAAHAEARARVERRIVEAVATGQGAQPVPGVRTMPGVLPAALGLAGAIVAGGYLWLGRPDALDLPLPATADPAAAGQGEAAAAPHTMETAQMAAMVDSLAQRLRKNPQDAEGWAMLARSWTVLGEPARALQAYRQALDAGVQDAALLADLADALAVANGQRIEGEALQRVEQALALDPDQPKALSLAGTAAFDRGDYAGAVAHWAHLQDVGPADHPLVQQMAAGLAEAQRRLAGAAPSTARTTAGPVAAAVAAEAATTSFVAGTVRVGPALAAQVRPDDTVFVFARAADGPRMPLAVLRARVRDLPLQFRLDDSMAMSPALKLSGQRTVVVGARISRSGQAMASPGEPRVEVGAVPLGRHDVALTIDQGSL